MSYFYRLNPVLYYPAGENEWDPLPPLPLLLSFDLIWLSLASTGRSSLLRYLPKTLLPLPLPESEKRASPAAAGGCNSANLRDWWGHSG